MALPSTSMDKPQRWDVQYGRNMSWADVDEIMSHPPFKDMDEAGFPERTPLREILLNDARIMHYDAGELIVREGDYGNSAFVVLSGNVRVVLQPDLDQGLLGRKQSKKKNLIQSLGQLLSNAPLPETRNLKDYEGENRLITREDENRQHIILQDVPAVLNEHKTAVLHEGALVGEIAALSRIPRSASMFAESQGTRLLEIRWQGLREIMKYDKAMGEHITKIYRERALVAHLHNMEIFKYIDDRDLKAIADRAEFITFGDYDWSGEYKRTVKQGGGTIREPSIVEEGHYPNGVVLIKSGFARLCKKQGNGVRTLRYLGAGQHYGFSEIAYNWATEGDPVPYEFSVKAIGYAHVIIIPTRVMEELVLPQIPRREFLKLGVDLDQPGGKPPEQEVSEIDPELLEFLAGNRFMNGTASMVINLDLCVRCDDCVRACAATHGNNPRFLRHGPILHNIMVANACMHCADPVCMLGCPTGAIHRDKFEGQVVVNDKTCIGCGACATNCPFDAIRLVEIRDRKGDPVLSPDGSPIQKATKCDLCIDQMGGPSCERACPHGALKRVDMRDIDSYREWLRL